MCDHGEPRGVKYCPICRYAEAVQAQAGEAAKEQGMTIAEQPYVEWNEQAKAEIMRLARTGAPFTIEDVCDVVGLPGGSNKAVGAIMNRVARTRMIWKCGTRPASRVTSHRRILQVWRGAIATDSQETLWTD